MMNSTGDFRDTLYTIDKRGNRKWVYPRFMSGRFMSRRAVVAYALMAFYLALPWITIGGKQAVLLDIPHRRFVFFGVELWATDTIFLFLVLGTLAISLFFFTALLGRVWCGWACPETVFLEFLFRPIERIIEGSESERRKLDRAPWTLNKIVRKVLKHGFCATASWAIASTVLAYFIGREALFEMMTHSPLENPVPFAMTLTFMVLMAFQFGWFREQFCTVVCPYARFQSVLMDKHSLLVGYDRTRGEPRGKLRAKSESPLGDCIDCGLCVRVCPTGIDIRNGTQLECVACAACIDACDSVMQEIHRPLGLIRYDSEARFNDQPSSWVRPRIFVYATLFAILVAVFIAKIASRELVEVELIRPQATEPFSVDEHQVVTNQFVVRISNKTEDVQQFSIVQPAGSPATIVSPLNHFEAKPGKVVQVPLFIRAPQEFFRGGSAQVLVKIVGSAGVVVEREVAILGPGR